MQPRAGRLAISTAFFSIATGLSRIAGLVREIVAASYFGVKGPMSAFTIAFQVPNLIRSLFADAALQAAFVPVFTEQLSTAGEGAASAFVPGLHRAARASRAEGGVPRRLRARVRDLGVARRAHCAVRAARAGDHAAVRAGIRRPADGPDGQPRAADVPDRADARALGAGGRGAEQLRALRGARDRAAVLEPRDHRHAGRADAGVRGRRPHLRVRDRHPARDAGAAPAAAAVAAAHRLPARARLQLARRAGHAGPEADVPRHARASG